MISLTDQEFLTLTSYIKERYGINLTKKRVLIEGRLSNMLRERGFATFGEYFNMVFNDASGSEIKNLLNKLTTNHTYFMREVEHFEYMKSHILPQLAASRASSRDLRIWSAGCSTGQEPYNIAMIVDEFFGSQKHLWDTTILATDLSVNVLEKAKLGIYPAESLNEVPPDWTGRYFIKRPDGTVQVNEKIRQEVVFKHFNLMDPFVYKKPFDLIFCRNVMIYFDAPTKEALVNKFYQSTAKGGYLLIGHSEVLNKESCRYRYVKPAIYQKGTE